MISAQTITEGISLAWAMARRRDDFAEGVDLSSEAVFRSFWAIPLALPAHLVAVEVQRRMLVDAPNPSFSQQMVLFDPTVLLIAQLLIFLGSWGVQLFILSSLAQRRAVGWKVSPLIIGYNWSRFAYSLFIGAVVGASLLLGVVGLGSFGELVAVGLLLWVQWGIFRMTLDLGVGGTVGVIVLLLIAAVGIGLVVMAGLSVFGLMPEMPTSL